MRFKIKAKDLNTVLQKITDKVEKSVITGSAESLQQGTQTGLETISVIGITAKSYLNQATTGTKTILVGSILKGLGVWGLQKGIDSNMTSHYPGAGTKGGSFVSFDEEPHLLQWAQKKTSFDTQSLSGIYIGRSNTTNYGKVPWFTNITIPDTKNRLNTNIRKQFK